MYLGLGCNTTITTVFSIPSTKIKSGKESKKGRKITIKPTGKDRKKLKTSPQNTVFLTSKVYLTLLLGLIHILGDNTLFSHIIVLLQGWVPKPWFFSFEVLTLNVSNVSNTSETKMMIQRLYWKPFLVFRYIQILALNTVVASSLLPQMYWIHSFLDVIISQKSRLHSFSFSWNVILLGTFWSTTFLTWLPNTVRLASQAHCGKIHFSVQICFYCSWK